MAVVAQEVEQRPPFKFGDSGFRELVGLYEPWQGAVAPEPRLVALNDQLAVDLGLDPDVVRTPAGVEVLVGAVTPPGATPVAQAYAGHQFGSYSPRLGDGRALLVGELLDPSGNLWDLHLKGSGRTPFARGGDGMAALGPMLREFVMCESMHALGVPTTRALAVVATGSQIRRDAMVPGAVLARVAASHLRVGTFEYAARRADPTLVQRLADHAMARHFPQAAEAERPYLAFLEAVIDAQASLVARWMLVGFIHGVMNTDNMTISGETIDYGPCALMDTYDPSAVFSSIDHAGRYAYANQPQIAVWNLARLAETLLSLIDHNAEVAVESATGMLSTFSDRYDQYWGAGIRTKLGIAGSRPDDDRLIADLFLLLADQRVDFTSWFRSLSEAARGNPSDARALAADPSAVDPWLQRWSARIGGPGLDAAGVAQAMEQANPIYIPRNHLVEEALLAANGGDLVPFEQLVEVTRSPFGVRSGFERYALPAPADTPPHRTFCGT